MRVASLVPFLLGVAVASPLTFTPDTTGFDSAVATVMALVITLATIAVAVGVMWFVVTVWIHRGS